MLVVTSTYRQRLKTVKSVFRTVKKWTGEAVESLQGCMDCTDWEAFRNACSSLDEYTDVVTSYISFCEDLCAPPKKWIKFGIDKLWFCKLVKVKIVEKYEAFKIRGMTKYKTDQVRLTAGGS